MCDVFLLYPNIYAYNYHNMFINVANVNNNILFVNLKHYFDTQTLSLIGYTSVYTFWYSLLISIMITS